MHVSDRRNKAILHAYTGLALLERGSSLAYWGLQPGLYDHVVSPPATNVSKLCLITRKVLLLADGITQKQVLINAVQPRLHLKHTGCSGLKKDRHCLVREQTCHAFMPHLTSWHQQGQQHLLQAIFHVSQRRLSPGYQ